jgi:hypothetical protein
MTYSNQSPIKINTPCGRYTINISETETGIIHYYIVDNSIPLPEFDAANWLEILSKYNVVASGYV